MDPAPPPRDHRARDGNDVMGESGDSQDLNALNETSSHANSETIGSASIILSTH